MGLNLKYRNKRLKKAVNITAKYRGDDSHHVRLLTDLIESLPLQIIEISRIKDQVYKVKAKDLQFVLKGFPSYKRLKIQEAFTDC